MKTITLTQPWATLVALGAKRIETRSWQTAYRGPLAIHAAKGWPRWAQDICGQEPFLSALGPVLYDPRRSYDRTFQMLPRGFIVAVCDLVDIYPTTARVVQLTALDVTFSAEKGFSASQVTSFQLPPPEPEMSFGDYSPGRFAWLLENIRALPEPIPAKGTLGLWEWEADNAQF